MKKNWTDIEINQLKYDYPNILYSPEFLEKKYNRSWNSIKKKMQRLSIKRTNCKYVLNEHYFNKINTERKAYYLGLLMADGTNVGTAVRLGLKESDKYILEEFKKDLQTDKPIYVVNNQQHNVNWENCHVLSLNNKYLINDLYNHGIIPNKTFYTTFPNIDEKLWAHFIRGYFDGDGCLYINKRGTKRFILVGTELFLSKIKDIMINKCKLNNNKLYKCSKNNNIKILEFGGNTQVSRIYDYLYKDATIYLSRKQLKF